MLFAWEWKVRMKSHFHITGFTASLALKQKFGATRKFSEMVYFSKLLWGSNRPEPPKPRPPPPRQRGWLLPRHKRQLCSRKTPPLASKSPWKLCNNDKGVQTPLRGFEVYHSSTFWWLENLRWLLSGELIVMRRKRGYILDYLLDY